VLFRRLGTISDVVKSRGGSCRRSKNTPPPRPGGGCDSVRRLGYELDGMQCINGMEKRLLLPLLGREDSALVMPFGYAAQPGFRALPPGGLRGLFELDLLSCIPTAD
jgi:hypothetical protein